MAHIVTEMSAFSTNCTFCHDSTSFKFFTKPVMTQAHNKAILTEIQTECKKKIAFFENKEKWKPDFRFFAGIGLCILIAILYEILL